MLDPLLVAPQKVRGLRRAEYERLVALGMLEDERVELLHGMLVEMGSGEAGHSGPLAALTMVLAPGLKDRALVRVQLPIVGADESEPEPDLAVVPFGDYRTELPTHALLVVEVAGSSLNKDRKVKAPLYAASGFREYWLVSVPEQVVEIFRVPDVGGYREITRHARGDVLSPAEFDDIRVPVTELLG